MQISILIAFLKQLPLTWSIISMSHIFLEFPIKKNSSSSYGGRSILCTMFSFILSNIVKVKISAPELFSSAATASLPTSAPPLVVSVFLCLFGKMWEHKCVLSVTLTYASQFLIVLAYFMQTRLKGIGQEAILLIQSPLLNKLLLVQSLSALSE